MSYKPEEKGFNQLLEDLREEKTLNVILFKGEEEYLINWATRQVVDQFINHSSKELDLVTFEEGKRTIEDVIQACETLPLLSKRKVVILEDFQPVWGKVEKGFTSDAMKQLEDLIENMPPSTQLILIGGNGGSGYGYKKKTSLHEKIIKEGQEYTFPPLNENDLKKFILKRLKQWGKTAKPSVIQKFIVECGYTNKEIDYALFNLENDLKKIVALSDQEEITEREVTQGISDNLEHNTFKMLDAISNNRKEEAFLLINDLMLSGASEFMLLGSIISQLEIMLQVKEMKGEGMNLMDMKKILKIHEFRIKKAMGFAEKYSEKRLMHILKMAFQTEKNIKYGLLNKTMAMELLIGEI